jgi:hypothetical protein
LGYGKKLTNSGPLRKSADKHSIYTIKIGVKLLAHRGGGHRCNQRFALGQGVMAEPLGFENLLAGQETLGIAPEAVAQGGFDVPHMKELKVWRSCRYFPHRQASYNVSFFPECLPYPFKNLFLSAIFLRVTEEHPAFW